MDFPLLVPRHYRLIATHGKSKATEIIHGY